MAFLSLRMMRRGQCREALNLKGRGVVVFGEFELLLLLGVFGRKSVYVYVCVWEGWR